MKPSCSVIQAFIHVNSEFQPVPPKRRWLLNRHGLSLHVCEWGDDCAPPILMVHGAFDNHASFSDLGPRLAHAGWRAISYDQRGHGDSDTCNHLSWMADVCDLIAIATQVGAGRRIPVIGHSKGGSLLNYAVLASPQTFSCFINLDGLSFDPHTSQRAVYSDTLTALRAWACVPRNARRPRIDTLEKLIESRQKANARLPRAVVDFLGRRLTSELPGGWRWKHDPVLPLKRIAPHPGHWLLKHMQSVSIPMLAIQSGIQEGMAWPVEADVLKAALPSNCTLEVWPEHGHFVHLEAPIAIAERILRFLGAEHERARSAAQGIPRAPEPATLNEPATQIIPPYPEVTRSAELHAFKKSKEDMAPRPSTLLTIEDGDSGEFLRGCISSWQGEVLRYQVPTRGSMVAGGFVTAEGCLLDIARLCSAAERLTIIGCGRARFLALTAAATLSVPTISFVLADDENKDSQVSTHDTPAMWNDDNGVFHDTPPEAWTATLWRSIQAANCMVWRDVNHHNYFGGQYLPTALELTKSTEIRRLSFT